MATLASFNGSKVTGTVNFEQADTNSPTIITFNILGNDPNAMRGIHIHEVGASTNCTDAKGHCKMSRDPISVYAHI